MGGRGVLVYSFFGRKFIAQKINKPPFVDYCYVFYHICLKPCLFGYVNKNILVLGILHYSGGHFNFRITFFNYNFYSMFVHVDFTLMKL